MVENGALTEKLMVEQSKRRQLAGTSQVLLSAVILVECLITPAVFPRADVQKPMKIKS